MIFQAIASVLISSALAFTHGVQSNTGSPIGINTQSIQGSSAQAPLNILNSAGFWQAAKSSGGGQATTDDVNLLLDQFGNIITFSTGLNGQSLTATQGNLVVYNAQETYLYPAGANSYQLSWDGVGAWGFARDVTTASCSSSPCSVSIATATQNGIEIDLTSTGVNSTVTFSGVTASWSGSNFTAGTPIAFQSSGTLPAPLVQNTVYYVLSAGLGANSFEIGAVAGGSPISFSGGSGTHKAYANWVRNAIMAQTKYAALARAGELWNPDYVAFYRGYRAIRFIQMQNTYAPFETTSTVTFSGTTATWVNGTRFTAGQTVLCQNSGGALPTPLIANTVYYVLQVSTNGALQFGTSPTGSAITFSGGSGTTTCYTHEVLNDHDRAPNGYLMWGAANSANDPSSSWGGPPIEALVALANELNTDMYINIPHLADVNETSWNTAVATIVHSNLHSNLKVYLEESNEVWSNAPNLTTGWSSLGSQLFSGSSTEYYIYKSIKDMAVWTSVWGADSSRLVRILAGQASNDCYGIAIADMTARRIGGSSPTTATISIANPAIITVASLPSYAVAGTPVAFTTTGGLPTGITASTSGMNACGSTINSDTDYYISINNLTATTFELADTQAHALAGTNTVATSGSQSGTQTVYFLYWDNKAYTHFDVYAIAPYFNGGERLPSAWTADADGGVAKFYTEYTSGGLLPTSASASHTTAGTSTAFTVTSGQGLPSTPANGTIVNVKFNVANGASATLAADGGAAFPLQNVHGATIGTGALALNAVWPFVFTSATCQGTIAACTGSVTPGWRQQAFGYTGSNGSGYIYEGLSWITSAITNVTQPRGLPLIGYEFGQTMSDFGQGDTTQTYSTTVANQSVQMGLVYQQFLAAVPALGGTIMWHYADFTPPGDFGQFGMQENVNQATTPKTSALAAFIASTQCWWSNCRH